jgi:hypothetical protein
MTTLTIEVLISDTLLSVYQAIRSHVPKESNLRNRHCENLKISKNKIRHSNKTYIYIYIYVYMELETCSRADA